MKWLKEKLLSCLKTGLVVVMDNAPWHKGEDIKKLIESTGAKALKMPKYSPDLNPIEHAWANLKANIKSNANTHKNISHNIRTQITKMNQSI